ncbi:MAG: amidohydrolase family protein, partial [Halanaerobiales bacterium]
TLDQAVRNISRISSLPLYKIINMVTYNPARLLGLDDELGWIRAGNRADFVLLDKGLKVKSVFKDGLRIY